MKQLLFAAFLLAGFLSFPVSAQDAAAGAPITYTGHVDGTKDLSAGTLLINLDGAFPNSKMTLFFGAADKAKFTRLPAVGDTVTATGVVIQFKGHPEMKMTDPTQLTFTDAAGAPPATNAAPSGM